MHLTTLNANFQFYQLNNCNCLFNCLSDITKPFVVASMPVKVNYFYLFPAKLDHQQTGLTTN